MSKDLIECMQSEMHLTSCDNDGYCNYCGYQDNNDEGFEVNWDE